MEQQRVLMAAVAWCLSLTACGAGEALPDVQIFVPGFAVHELRAKVTNLVHVEYASDGRLFAAGYDGRIHLLRDSDRDGLEDEVITIWDKFSDDYPLGFAVHNKAVYVLLKNQLVRFVDTDKDGVPEKREVVLSDWDDSKLLAHPLILQRRVDFAMGLAIGPDESIYIGMGNAAYNNAYMIDHDGKLGDKHKSHYSPRNQRGCVLKFSPDGQQKELFATGTRYLMCLQFNKQGDLFASDQEGATWLPNGNPFDELLHLQSGRHYGFPPRHPRHLPDVIDEPSVFDYAPQHQSVCGFRFNDGTVFGPAGWQGDALLTGFTRGKLYRTKLVKTDAGYVAQNQLFGAMQSLAADLTVSPTGELVVTSHSGNPDWGTGPRGSGHLYKIRYRGNGMPMPVFACNAGPGEVRVTFDKPLDPRQLKDLSKQIRITTGKYVFAGDRFETIRPGYEVVKQQTTAPRLDVPVLSTALSADDHTVVLFIPRTTSANNLALTFPTVSQPATEPGAIAQQPTIELLTDFCGVIANWSSAADERTIESWLPHPELDVSSQLTQQSIEHRQFFNALRNPGKLVLRGQLDLWEMLHPAIQPNAKLDYERSAESVSVTVTSASSFTMKINSTDYSSADDGGEHRLTLKHVINDRRWLPFEIALSTSEHDPKLQIRWFTADDQRPRAFPLRRFYLPWALPAQDASMNEIARDQWPELRGGDRDRGREVFVKVANCSKCHQIWGEGAKIGPNLSNLIHRDYESVMRDIRTPSAAINPDYLSYMVNLKDGRVIAGVINGETKDSLKIADSNGKLTDVAREDIDEILASKTSVMPEGLLKNLSPEQIRDLMTFLLLEPKTP